MNCDICGSEMRIKVSFNPKQRYRNKRETYICSCGYSTIKETDREKDIRLRDEGDFAKGYGKRN